MVGLSLQQAIALFVLKSGAGFHMFKWLSTLASDFLAQGLVGAAFFFDQETVTTKHWIFVNTVRHNTCLSLNEISNAYWPVMIARYYHFLHCIHSNALLSRGHAVDHQALRLVLLQDYERIWC
jgi:hypothetical protein